MKIKINNLESEYEPTISLRCGQLAISFGESTEEIVFSKQETGMIEEIFKPAEPDRELVEALREVVADFPKPSCWRKAKEVLAKYERKPQ